MALRGSFGRQLGGEVPAWVREGLISQDQGEAIVARYARDRGASRPGVQVVAIAGSVLVALGLILIIANNWDTIHPWVKLAGLFALLASAHYAGWRVRFGIPSLPRFGEALLLLGGILFLAGIGLVSQIYHLDARPADGVLIWMLGIAALPWLAESSALQALSTVAFIAWLGMEAAATDSWIHLGSGLWPYAAAATVLGGALFLAGERERVWPFVWSGRVVSGFGLAVFAGGSYLLGFMRHRELVFAGRPGKATLLFVLLGAFLLLLAPALLRIGKDPGAWGFMLCFAATVLLASTMGSRPGPFFRGLPFAVLFWALQIGFALLLVSGGVREERPGWVNLGAFLFALQVITRYFDLFVNMMNTGLLFVLGGALLLGVGYITERKRRQLVAGLAAGRA